MDVLLTFTGFHDPYFKGLVDQEEQPGPILSLLSTRSFDHIFLFGTPITQRVTADTKDAIKKIHHGSEVHVLEINLADSTNYQEIFRGLRAHLHRIIEDFSSAHFFVAVASGTPHMHACWVLLTTSGEIPARILHVRPPHFVTKQHPLVTEVDLSSREFPTVRFQDVSISALRERRSDIPKLALCILDRLNGSLRRPKRLSVDALSRLQSHNWAGNVRDLENVIERSFRLCRNDVLDADDLLITEPVTYADSLDALPEPYEGFALDEFLGSARKQMILRALEAANGNQSRAVRMLGITPQAVHKFLQSRPKA